MPSVRDRLHSSAGSLSPGSVIASPQIAAMLDITPLPSPVGSGTESFRMLARSRSRGSSIGSNSAAQAIFSSQIPASSPPRRKVYHGLRPTPEGRPLSLDSPKSRERTRSTSEYVPDSIAIPKPRPIVVSGSATPTDNEHSQTRMHREEFLGNQRGIVSPITKPPSPPPTIHDDFSGSDIDEPAAKRARTDLYTVKGISDGKPRRYKSIKELGQGTFSTVYLAVRQIESEDSSSNIDFRKQSVTMEGIKLRSQRLVAVKVVHHGPAGGADAERVEVSLQREVEIMRMTKHPSIVHLKAFSNTDGSRALLVMNYCPGGDLFEVASTNLDVLVPSLVRRIFAELVSAVRYLHQKFIVHRDIKLENVLLNIPVAAHCNVPDWQTLDRAVVTLTDLGLSKRIPEPPESPLLTTRCGSEDYAAPELLMGHQYDGRQTDAWALGVLLYALMEGRLPFDPLPGARGDPAVLRTRTPHRIARCEWAWWKFGDEDGDWDVEKGREFEGAFACVNGLLKRNSRRKGLAEIREMEWVMGGIDVDGGLRWVEEEAL
jgi:protein-serine/threonine kinase